MLRSLKENGSVYPDLMFTYGWVSLGRKWTHAIGNVLWDDETIDPGMEPIEKTDLCIRNL